MAPYFLPDGRRFLFCALWTSEDASGIYLGSLDGEAPTRLTPASSAGVYLPSGWLLWVRTGHADAGGPAAGHQRRPTLTGAPVTVADGVGSVGQRGSGHLRGGDRAGGVPDGEGTAPTDLVRSIGHGARHCRRSGQHDQRAAHISRRAVAWS